jgi:hypothetical protein
MSLIVNSNRSCCSGSEMELVDVIRLVKSVGNISDPLNGLVFCTEKIT